MKVNKIKIKIKYKIEIKIIVIINKILYYYLALASPVHPGIHIIKLHLQDN